MIVYIYGKCSTCKDAIRFLEMHKVRFTLREITETPPSISELKKMLKFQNGNLKKLFNTSGMLYKEMQLSKKLESMSVDQALKLLSKHGMLVKRPFVIGKDFGITGFKESDWKQLLNSD